MSSSRREKGKGRDYDRPPVQTKDVPWYNRWPTPFREGNDPSASGYENPVTSSEITYSYDAQMTDAASPSSFIYGAQSSSSQPSAAGPSGTQAYGAEASGSSSYDSQGNVSQHPRFQASFTGPSSTRTPGTEHTRDSPAQQPARRYCYECGATAASNPFSIFCNLHKQQTMTRMIDSMGPPPVHHCIVCNGRAHGLSVVCSEHEDKSYLLTADELNSLRDEHGCCKECFVVMVDRGKFCCNGCLDKRKDARQAYGSHGKIKRQAVCTECRKPIDKGTTCDECHKKKKKEREAKKKNARR